MSEARAVAGAYFRYRVNGLSEIREKLRNFPDTMRTKIIRKAMYKSSRVPIAAIKEAIRQEGLIDTGTMLKRIGARVLQRRKTNQMVLLIGPIILKGGTREERQAKRAKLGIERDPFYIRFLEFGTEYIKARHFVQRAFKASSAALLDRFTAELRVEYQKQWEKSGSYRTIKKK